MKLACTSTLIYALICSGFASANTTDLSQKNSSLAKTYIVQLKDKPLATHRQTRPAFALTEAHKKIDPNSPNYRKHANKLSEQRRQAIALVPNAKKIHDYKIAFNGFAAQMSESDLERLKNHKDVLKIWEDKRLKLQTNSTPSFLGLKKLIGPWALGATGENVVVGVIDSGIHPEHPSVADHRTPKRGSYGFKVPYGPVPKSFTGTGCEFGNTAANPLDLPFECNNKLIKAQSFSAGFLSTTELAEHEYLSARDAGGHGTHTATTAAGNYGVRGSINGESIGTLSGMAPRARIAVYKVCWDALNPDNDGCFSSDAMAAIDQAVADGVDIINYSVGGSDASFNQPDDIAFLNAANAGVFVATSAGNSGPGAATTGTPASVPWITAVAAIEDDENFATGLRLDAPADLVGTIEGLEGGGPVKLTDIGTISATVVTAEPLNACAPLTNTADMAGNIALVMRGDCGFGEKYQSAAEAGAQAIVVFNDGTAADRIDPITMSATEATIPGIMIAHPDGDRLLNGSEIAGTLSENIKISRANRIADFSSRGMNRGAPDIIKPDIAAPGVNTLAGAPPASSNGELFASLSGTSMASPHVAGVMALLKQAHPDWTPAMAKSALMTTARQDIRKTFGPSAADPFDVGAGIMRPTRAFSPGLVYDAGPQDYQAFLCGAEQQPQTIPAEDCAALQELGFSLDSSDLNLPSIAISELASSQTITRKVTSVAPGTRWYWASVEAPTGFRVKVSPRLMRIKKGETASYTVTFSPTDYVRQGQWAFGSLTWSSSINHVRSPIAVRSVPLGVASSVSAEGNNGSLDIPLAFSYNGNYEASLNGLTEGVTFPGTIEDGELKEVYFAIPEGTTLARIALFDADVGEGNGSDDLDLQIYGPAPDFPLIDTSGNSASTEAVDIPNPTPGEYRAIVVNYNSAPGPTPYTLFNFNFNGQSNKANINHPATAVAGTTGTLNLEWFGLTSGTRALGIIEHGDGVEKFGSTELMINTQ